MRHSRLETTAAVMARSRPREIWKAAEDEWQEGSELLRAATEILPESRGSTHEVYKWGLSISPGCLEADKSFSRLVRWARRTALAFRLRLSSSNRSTSFSRRPSISRRLLSANC